MFESITQVLYTKSGFGSDNKSKRAHYDRGRDLAIQEQSKVILLQGPLLY